jgi:hypothetical protein
MGKASELDDWLERNPLTPEETEMRDGPRPKLRLGPNVLAQALDPSAKVKDVLVRVSEAASKVTVLHDAQSGATAFAIPEEQYLELITSYIRDRDLSEVKSDGRIAPSDETLSELGVEEINPRDTWIHTDYDPRATPEG